MRCAVTSPSKRRVLFTGGGGAAAEALYHLQRDRYDVHLADADPGAKPAGVPADVWHPVPRADAPDFVDAMRALCAELQIDVLVPGVDEELARLSGAREQLPCDVLLPTTRFIELHLDKLSSAQHLRRYGFAAPLTDGLDDRRSAIGFPCIVKPRQGRGSRNVAQVRSEAELQAHLTLSRRPASDFIVQEYAEGQEYTVTMVATRTAELRAVVPVRVDIKRGITLRGETEHDAAVIAACVGIHAADPVPGCFNIQLIKTADNDIRVFEINPRISTTTCLALAAGIDFVGLYLGTAPSTVDVSTGLSPFANGLRLKRSWVNEFFPGARDA